VWLFGSIGRQTTWCRLGGWPSAAVKVVTFWQCCLLGETLPAASLAVTVKGIGGILGKSDHIKSKGSCCGSYTGVPFCNMVYPVTPTLSVEAPRKVVWLLWFHWAAQNYLVCRGGWAIRPR